jgi:PhnB protein
VTREPRPGFRTVTPRLVVDDVAGLVGFFQLVFEANGDVEQGRPVELQLGDSVVLVSSTGAREAFPGFLYVYVDDADRTYEAAVRAGATALEAPLDTSYGDRRAMVRDPFGNVIQIAHPR